MSRRGADRVGIHSITWRLFAGVTACIVAVLAAVYLLNTFALKDYYIEQKQRIVAQAFGTINQAAEDTKALYDELIDLQDNRSVSAVIWSGRKLLYSTQNSDRFQVPLGVGHAPGTYEVTVSDEDQMLADPNATDSAILLVGTLDNGWHVYLRAPIAAIEESVAVTNRFLLFVGGAVLIVALVLVWQLSRLYTTPLRQLSQVADRVAQLDFGGRYTGDSKDEIGQLGRSINAMSVALEEAVTELKNANARLLSDNRRKDEQDRARRAFIANVSHELKTPIALIGTYAEGLREDIAVDGNNREYYCSVIEDEAHKISQLLRRMTMLMQLESGADQLEIERFDIAELLINLMEKNRIRFDEKKATLSLPSRETVAVYADAYLMENVLTNFLSNAYNHVREGGRVSGSITRLSDTRVRIAVHNTGAPIAQEDLPRVWESFYKVDKARTRAYGGTGIGLSVVAAIMKAHGMPYGVVNRDDGVEFYVELETK